MSKSLDFAKKLEGSELKNGWIVGKPLVNKGYSSGGRHSVCYQISRGDEICFLKAYNLAEFLANDENPDDLMRQINIMTGQYEYEKRLSEYCLNRHTDNVACVIDSGTKIFPYYELKIPVPYLIFEMADGDAHEFLEHNKNLDSFILFSSLHQVAVGLKQLHTIGVYHQDVKPSNILTYGENTKLGDLGRSIHQDLQCPFIDDSWWGDKNYLPPEIKYDAASSDMKVKMLLTDLYLLGSLIYFYFFNCTFNGRLYQELPEEFGPENGLTYGEVKAHLINAFNSVIAEAKEEVHRLFNDEKIESIFISIISTLCHPDIKFRHHINININYFTQNPSVIYSLERYISDLQYLYRLSKYKLRTHVSAATTKTKTCS